MKIVVVVVVYNGRKWIDACFSSLRESTMDACIIAIDNSSNDGSADKIGAEYPEVELIRSEENLGFARANNMGIALALRKGADYIFLLNQDAWVDKETLGKLVDLSERYPEYGIISPIHLDGRRQELDYNFALYVQAQKCPRFISDLYIGSLRELYEIEFVNAAAWLMTRDCVNKTGLLEPAFFLYGEDGNYLERVKYHGFKVGITPSCCICHDRGDRKGKPANNDLRNMARTQTLMTVLNILLKFRKVIYKAIKFRVSSVTQKVVRLDFRAAWVELIELGFILLRMGRLKNIRKRYTAEGYLILNTTSGK